MKKILIAGLLLLSATAIAQERGSHPELDALRNEKDPGTLQQKLKQLEEGTDQDLMILVWYHGKDNAAKADSIRAAIRRRHGAAQNAVVGGSRPAAEKVRLYHELVTNFANYRTTIGNNVKDLPVRAVVYAFIAEGDTAGAMKYARELSDTLTMPSQFSSLGNVSLQADLPELAEHFFKRSVETYEAITVVPNPQGRHAPTFYTEYATALTANGKPAEGLNFARKAYGVNQEDKVAIAAYAKALADHELHAEALPVLEQAIRHGVADAGLRAAYRSAYLSVHGEKGYSERLASLTLQQQEQTRTELRGQMISEPAPDFSLQDLEGKTWSLADLKGKTVVLDFWATWCVPCIRSFPAMQMAVDKYRDDPSVVFLFIHTWERSADATRDAQRFITNNNYDFTVLMDLRKDGATANEVVTNYQVQGIPAKFVLDGSGRIRFKMTGSSGNDESAVQELSAMIDLAQAST